MSMSRVPGSMSPTAAAFFVSPIIYLGEILALRRAACQKVRPPSLVASLRSFRLRDALRRDRSARQAAALAERAQLWKRLDEEFSGGMDEAQRRGVRDRRGGGPDSKSGPAEDGPASCRRCGIREQTFDA